MCQSFSNFHQDGFLSTSIFVYSDMCFAWQPSMKSLDQIGQTSVQRGTAGRRGPQSRDNASTHAWTETPHSRNTHTYTQIHNGHTHTTVASLFSLHADVLLLVLISPWSHPELLSCVPTTRTRACFGNVRQCMRVGLWVVCVWGRGGEKKKVCPTPRAREVTGTTTNPEAVPMATSVAAHNEGERE